jgi:hypothetical protein
VDPVVEASDAKESSDDSRRLLSNGDEGER